MYKPGKKSQKKSAERKKKGKPGIIRETRKKK
jgi:hypothetical protein